MAELLHGCILSPLWCECATGPSDLALEQSPDLLCWHLSAVSWCWPVCQTVGMRELMLLSGLPSASEMTPCTPVSMERECPVICAIPI